MPELTPIFDVVIASAGASGLAAAVKQAMRGGVSIAVVDPALRPKARFVRRLSRRQRISPSRLGSLLGFLRQGVPPILGWRR